MNFKCFSIRKRKRRHQRRHGLVTCRCLNDLRPGRRARVVEFNSQITSERRAQLQAYGVIPGQILYVHQQIPVTVIQIDHTELALEAGLAKFVLVLEI